VVTPQHDDLKDKLLDLGQMAEMAVSRAMEALLRHDTLLAKAVIQQDEEIDRAEVEIQEHCLTILERERPTGDELRFVVAVLKINDNLERVGDLAENIADVVLEVANWERFKRVGGCKELGERSQSMLRQSLDALVRRDAQLARQVVRSDAEVDRLQESIRQRIEHEMDIVPENASPLMKLEYVTRQLERVGDVATNIAEEVIYMVEGRIVRHDKRLLGRD
jgi:phosphate transport system protein